jgi:hypothetical protein
MNACEPIGQTGLKHRFHPRNMILVQERHLSLCLLPCKEEYIACIIDAAPAPYALVTTAMPRQHHDSSNPLSPRSNALSIRTPSAHGHLTVLFSSFPLRVRPRCQGMSQVCTFSTIRLMIKTKKTLMAAFFIAGEPLAL